jgi:thioester reductase-like protein
MFGGEEANADCAVALARRADNRMNIINGYGPTEITVDATNYFVTTADADRESIPIGKALANKKLYVLDPFMNPLPVGVPGELFIGGIGVADGYLNRPDITAERFLDNPFATARERQTGRNLRIYRTGDLVKWEPDGNLLYIGRTDFQVKIRGFRIEPGEIETVMRTCPNVIDCVVLTPDIGGSKTLVGYYVPAGGAVVQPEDLRAHLARQLPDYMIPSHLVACPCFPLTPGGKINRQALPLPTISESAPADQRAPRNPTEKDVVSAFKTVLASGEIGLATNFFDAGGTSLQAVTLTAHLQKQYNITVNDIFRYQTVGLLADHIQPHEQTLLHRLEAVKQAAAEQNAADVAHRDDVPPAWHEELTAYRADNRRYHDVDLSRTRDYRQIMLTGATGFLGAYLLREMLEHSSATMHLPIRANGIEQARQRLAAKLAAYFGDDFFARHSRRLHVLCSDLAQPRLGLDARTYQQLSQTVDCIINSAALVKHYGHLADFQTANVKTVENLVAFAHAGQRKELHHMSTVSVGLGHDGDKAGIPWTEDRFAAGQHSDNHYVSTKCEAEQRILSARADGLTATIYRLGNMLCDSVTGAYQQNIDDNGFFQTLKAFCEIGAVSNTHDECEISHVDQSARAVRLLYDKPALANETFHIRNPHCVKLSEILTDPSLGLYLDTLSFPDFIDRLITLHDTEGLRAEVEAVLLHRGWLSSGAQGARVVPFSERTEILLQRLDFAWQPPQARQLLPLMHEAMKERLDLLAAHPLFKDMDAGQRRRLAFSARRKIVPERTILWQKDDPHTTCGIIRSGHVALFVTADSGVDVLVDACGPGRAIGCEALLDNTRAQHSAKTMEDETDLLCLDGTLLKTMSSPWAS